MNPPSPKRSSLPTRINFSEISEEEKINYLNIEKKLKEDIASGNYPNFSKYINEKIASLRDEAISILKKNLSAYDKQQKNIITAYEKEKKSNSDLILKKGDDEAEILYRNLMLSDQNRSEDLNLFLNEIILSTITSRTDPNPKNYKTLSCLATSEKINPDRINPFKSLHSHLVHQLIIAPTLSGIQFGNIDNKNNKKTPSPLNLDEKGRNTWGTDSLIRLTPKTQKTPKTPKKVDLPPLTLEQANLPIPLTPEQEENYKKALSLLKQDAENVKYPSAFTVLSSSYASESTELSMLNPRELSNNEKKLSKLNNIFSTNDLHEIKTHIKTTIKNNIGEETLKKYEQKIKDYLDKKNNYLQTHKHLIEEPYITYSTEAFPPMVGDTPAETLLLYFIIANENLFEKKFYEPLCNIDAILNDIVFKIALDPIENLKPDDYQFLSCIMSEINCKNKNLFNDILTSLGTSEKNTLHELKNHEGLPIYLTYSKKHLPKIINEFNDLLAATEEHLSIESKKRNFLHIDKAENAVTNVDHSQKESIASKRYRAFNDFHNTVKKAFTFFKEEIKNQGGETRSHSEKKAPIGYDELIKKCRDAYNTFHKNLPPRGLWDRLLEFLGIRTSYETQAQHIMIFLQQEIGHETDTGAYPCRHSQNSNSSPREPVDIENEKENEKTRNQNDNETNEEKIEEPQNNSNNLTNGPSETQTNSPETPKKPT